MNILFIDDDPNIVNLYSVVLEPLCKDGEFYTASCPGEAKDIINEIKLDLIVSDFDMHPHGTGEEVYNTWIDSINSNNDFMFFTSRNLEELDFYKTGRNNFFLQKPEKLKDFKNFVKNIIHSPVSEYSPIAIYQFARWSKTKVSVYIKINEEKHIKIFNVNEEYSLERLNSYIDKGTKFLYIKDEDDSTFLKEYDYSSVFDKAKEFSFESLKQNHRLLNIQISMFGLTQQSLNTATDTTEKILDQINNNDKSLFDLIERMLTSSDFTYDHSYLTICIASFVCEKMMIDKKVLLKITTAALLHDILIPSNRLAQIHDTKPEEVKDLEQNDMITLSKHNLLGSNLNELEKFGNDISKIIEFHHTGISDYPIEEHKKPISQLNIQQSIFLASHFIAIEIYKHNYELSKLSDILTFSQYKYSGKYFDKIWNSLDYAFRQKLN